MTDNELQSELEKIKNMSRIEMARLWRFAKSGHKYFLLGTPLSDAFDKRFKELGGMSPEISKEIGW